MHFINITNKAKQEQKKCIKLVLPLNHKSAASLQLLVILTPNCAQTPKMSLRSEIPVAFPLYMTGGRGQAEGMRMNGWRWRMTELGAGKAVMSRYTLTHWSANFTLKLPLTIAQELLYHADLKLLAGFRLLKREVTMVQSPDLCVSLCNHQACLHSSPNLHGHYKNSAAS